MINSMITNAIKTATIKEDNMSNQQNYITPKHNNLYTYSFNNNKYVNKIQLLMNNQINK